MKAIVQGRFGEPIDVLELQDIEQPAVAADEVLVRVHAASIHIGDVHVIRGVPTLMRPVFKRARADNRVPGTDIAGTVEAIGSNVTGLRRGDEVFGWCKGAFAEFVAVPASDLALKPGNMSMGQSSALGVSAFTALQALRDQGELESGQKVLITGASGGVGTFAVQIAKALGADVTGVCSTRNADMVRALGADHIVDYTREDFTRGEARYDLILDNIGNHSLSSMRSVLTPAGKLLANGALVSGFVGGLGHFAKAAVVSLFVRRQGRPFLSIPTAADLATLKQMAEDGQITPVIDKTYPLRDAPAALAHVGAGHSQGKTIVTVTS
jgi:NADPH:quinone reductase-like Zn-dependent oxidoreductase